MPERDVAAPAARRVGERALVGAQRRGHRRCCSARRSRCSSSGRCRSAAAGACAYYRALFSDTGSTFYVPPVDAIVNSLRYAALAAVIALVVGVCAAVPLARRGRGRWLRSLDTMLLLPLGTSAVTVGFGVLVLLSSDVTEPIGWIRDSPVARARSSRRWSRCRSSSGSRCPCSPASTSGCARRRRCSVRGRGGCGARSTCPRCGRGSPSPPGSRSRSRSGSSVRRCSSCAPTRRRLPVAVYRFLGRPGDLDGRPGDGDERRADARHGRHGRARRPRARRASGGVLMLEVRGSRVVAFERRAAPSTTSSFAVGKGEVVAVLGPSGSGKSTLLRAVAGLQRLDAGVVALDGDDVDRASPPHERGVGLMFQAPTLFPHRDVAGNVGFGLRMAGSPQPTRRRAGRRAARARRPARLRAARGRDALRRRAAAGRARAHARARAATAAARRAVRRARRGAARAARRGRRPAGAPARPDRPGRHPRPRGGVRARRPRARHARRPGRRRRHARAAVGRRPPTRGSRRFLGMPNVLAADVDGGVARTAWGELAVAGRAPAARTSSSRPRRRSRVEPRRRRARGAWSSRARSSATGSGSSLRVDRAATAPVELVAVACPTRRRAPVRSTPTVARRASTRPRLAARPRR